MADSITDFWRRWHMSLSTWLRDYLYVPLGGNRKGRARTYVNLALTMLLGGLWHGAQWQFVVWGGYHGVLLALERATPGRSFFVRLPPGLRRSATFLLVLLGWVFFRAASLGDAVGYFGHLFGVVPATAASRLIEGAVFQPFTLIVMAAAALIVVVGRRTQDWVEGAVVLPASVPRMAATFALFVVAVIELTTQSDNPFLYFQF